MFVSDDSLVVTVFVVMLLRDAYFAGFGQSEPPYLEAELCGEFGEVGERSG